MNKSNAKKNKPSAMKNPFSFSGQRHSKRHYSSPRERGSLSSEQKKKLIMAGIAAFTTICVEAIRAIKEYKIKQLG